MEKTMPFGEKSAWVMAVVLAVTGAGYAALVAVMSREAGMLVPPMLPTLVLYTIALAGLATVCHIVLAVSAPKDAQARLDERDRSVELQAGAWSGHVFAAGVALGLGLYLFSYAGDLLFYIVLASWIVAQACEYMFQIALYRARS